MTEPKAFTSRIITVFHEVPKLFDANYNDVNHYDNELQDLLHEIELLNFNAFQGYKLTKQIKDNRVKRRKAKDQNQVLKPLYDYVQKNGNVLKDMQKIQGEMDRIEKGLDERIYQPRAKTNMAEAFMQATENKKATTI